jgi:hypothetical protein
MDEAMLGESSRGACICEREYKQHIREATHQIVLEGGPEIKEEELLPLTIGDIRPNSEIPLTPRRVVGGNIYPLGAPLHNYQQ